MSPWLQVAAQATQISLASSVSMAPGHQHGFMQQHRPLTPDWPLIAIQVTDVNTDLGCSKSMEPDMATGSSLGLDLSMAWAGCAGSSYHPVPHLTAITFPVPHLCTVFHFILPWGSDWCLSISFFSSPPPLDSHGDLGISLGISLFRSIDLV